MLLLDAGLLLCQVFPEPIQYLGGCVREEYLQQAHEKIEDPNILINIVSRRVKQLKYGMKPLVESLEKLEPEDIALREVIEGKLDYELYEPSEEEV